MSPVLPEWLPLWAQLLILVVGAVFVLAFLLMPFAVFGLKGRLVEIELQLEDVRSDLRVIAARLSGGEIPRDRARAIGGAVEWTPPAHVGGKPEPEFRQPEFRPASSAGGSLPEAPSDARQAAPSPRPDPATSVNALAAAQRAAGHDVGKVVDASDVRRDVNFFPTNRADDLGNALPRDSQGDGADGSQVIRATDAYEARVTLPPEPQLRSEIRGEFRGAAAADPQRVFSGDRRMPWHEEQPPGGPQRGLSSGSPLGGGGDEIKRSAPGGRSEPVLRWPSRRNDEPAPR